MADVARIFAPVPQCAYCGAAHEELGVLCAKCRKEAEPATEAFVHNTAASVIRDLRLWEQQGFPLAGPVGDALLNAQKLYDATEPRVTVPRDSYVHCEPGNCWAYPAGTPYVLGPFETEELARDAFTAFAADRAKGGT